MLHTGPTGDGPVWLLVTLFTYALLRAAMRREPPLAVAMDVLLAAAAATLTGGMLGPYLVFSLVVCAGAGMSLGAVTGSVGGVLLGLIAVLAPAVTLDGSFDPSLREALAVAGLHPALAAVGAVLRRGSARSTPSAQLLTDTRRALHSLHEFATQVPHSLDTYNVVSTALSEMATAAQAIAGAVTMEVDGTPTVLGAFGLSGTEPIRGAPMAVLEDRLPEGHRRIVPLTDAGGHIGDLLCVRSADQPWSRRARVSLRDVATASGVALGNALAFQRIAQLSANDERQRIARDLHDGVAQSLAHLRFELDLIRRGVGRGVPVTDEELAPLADLAAHTVAEVRSLIGGLRAVTEPGGLAPALHDHIGALQAMTTGADVRLRVMGEGSFDPDVESHIFRIAQEALSNAVRHSKGSLITCRITFRGRAIDLHVTDDGCGIPTPPRAGVGLAAMSERAAAIGAELNVERRPHGGTAVRLRWCPREEGA